MLYYQRSTAPEFIIVKLILSKVYILDEVIKSHSVRAKIFSEQTKFNTG
jgi:hypothetical protein